MTAPKHTPGKWTLVASADGSFAIHAAAGVLCQRAPWDHRTDESRANGALMAAAPELFDLADEVETLPDVYRHNEDHEHKPGCPACILEQLKAKARAALAKARVK